MKLRNPTAFGPRLLAAALCLLALSALPARALDDEYLPDPPDYGANSGNCAMDVSVKFETACGLTLANFFGGLQETATTDPRFCNDECTKCCDTHNQMPGFDLLLLDSVCRCVEGFLLTGGYGALECWAPATINAAFTGGVIDEQQREYAIAARDLFLIGKLNLEYILSHNIKRHSQMVDHLKKVLPKGTPGVGVDGNVDDLARGVLALIGLVAVHVDACGQIDEWWEEKAVDACKNQCNRWFPKPPLPEPQPNPEGPATSGHDLEVQNNVVPEPDGSGGGWGDIVPDGTVTWVEEFGGVVPDPPLQ